MVGHLINGKKGRFAKMISYFFRTDKYAECIVIITQKEVNLGDGEEFKCNAYCCGKKICYKYFVKVFKINIAIYLFFQLLKQQSNALDSVIPITLAICKAFSFIMTPPIGISWLLLSINQLYIFLSTI